MDRAGLDAQPTEKSFQSKNRAILAALYVNVIYFSSSLKKKNSERIWGRFWGPLISCVKFI